MRFFCPIIAMLMAGIYIHIPFCRQACHYCDFYFTVSPRRRGEFVTALIREITLTVEYLQGEVVETIYFGGGTPSQLDTSDIARILEAIHTTHLTDLKEVTIETNPDDLTPARILELKELRQWGVNRLSIGVQSFRDADLQMMNRAHTAADAIDAIQRVQNAGFDTLTLDLIYGTPTMNDDQWRENIATFLTLDIPHLSAYSLTVEPRTRLFRDIQAGITTPPDSGVASEQFDILMDTMRAAGYEQYEISNFALPGRAAVHNTNYWRGIPYLGLGPSAHSYQGGTRRWNVANLNTYIHSIVEGKLPYEDEHLTAPQQANEYIMTSLRTQWGLDMRNSILAGYVPEIELALATVNPLHYHRAENQVMLSQAGKHFADAIAAHLFIVEND